MPHSYPSKITSHLLLLLAVVLISGCQSVVDVYLVSGKGRCNSSKNKIDTQPELTVVKKRLNTSGEGSFIEIGDVSTRYTLPDFRETAIELLKERALKCGARMLYLYPVKRIYDKIGVEASGEKTGNLHPTMYEQKGTMYRSRK